MKKLLLALVFLFGIQGLGLSQASDASVKEVASQSSHQLTAKYHLNESQSARMGQIQLRKLNNLNDIQGLKDTAPELYNAKLKNIQQGTLGSIRRVLSTPEQVALYDQTQAEVRRLKAAKQKELLSLGWKPAAIEVALMDIYQE
jgi:hypothetical protein